MSRNWEELTVAAFQSGHEIAMRIRIRVGDVCELEMRGPEIRAKGQARHLFAALATARQKLAPAGVQMACNGARVDVWPSAMLCQAGFGRRAYVLSVPIVDKTATTVDIFDASADTSKLGTVTEQREWFQKYWASIACSGGARGASDNRLLEEPQ